MSMYQPSMPMPEAPDAPVPMDEPMELLPPIADEAKDNLEETTKRLLQLFQTYRDYREKEVEPLWNAVYNAYHGVPPSNNYPNQSFYTIRETFRQCEVLKPQLADRLLPMQGKRFEFNPEHEGDEAEEEARAAEGIIRKHMKEYRGEVELMKWLDSVGVYGTSYLQYGWSKYKQVRRKVDKFHEDTGKPYWKRTTTELPSEGFCCHWIDHWMLYTDPFIDDCRDAPAVFKRELVSGAYLKTQVREGLFDAKTVRKAMEEGPGALSSDMRLGPEKQARWTQEGQPDDMDLYELLTAWTNYGWYYVILNNRHVLAASPNYLNEAPILTLKDYPQAGEHYGVGEPVVLLAEQDLVNDMASMWVDAVHLGLNPGMKYKRGIEKEMRQLVFKPGFKIPVEQMDDVMPFETQPHVFELANAWGAVLQRMQLGTGLTNELSGSSNQRTATGIVRLQDASGLRLEHKVRWMLPVFEELYGKAYELYARFLSEEVAVRMEGHAGKTFVKRYGPEVFMSNVDVEVLLPPNQVTPQEQQAKALTKYTAMRQDPLVNPEGLILDVLKAHGDPHPRRSLANNMQQATDALNEAADFMATGFYPNVQASDDHERHVMAMDMISQTPAFLQKPPEIQAVHNTHRAIHAHYLEQIQGMASQGTPQGQAEEAPGPQAIPEANQRAEDQFNNGQRGGEEQGIPPQFQSAKTRIGA